MRHSLLSAVLVAAVGSAVASPAAAQTDTPMAGGTRALVFHWVPYGGYVYSQTPFEVPSGMTIDTKKNTWQVGSQLVVDFRGNWSAFGNIAYADESIRIANYFPSSGELNLPDVSLWFFDGGLEYKFGAAGVGFRPLVQLGIGAVRYAPRQSTAQFPSGRSFSSSGSVTLGGNGGVGAEIGTKRVAVRIMAKDYLWKPEWVDRTAQGANIKRKLTNTVGIAGGLSIRLGSIPLTGGQ